MIVFLEVGMDVQWEAELSVEEMVNEGVRQAYMDTSNPLRASVPWRSEGDRINTLDNTPAVVYTRIVPGADLAVEIAAKGGGSEAKAKFTMYESFRFSGRLDPGHCSDHGCWLVPTGNPGCWDWRNT
ncbi:MAG: hypothetical protein CM1200mP9_08020 [Gammaproteobacteria bacterium]|nr:MAG: hypothetical protein CM1200mP9_08020 [Gammaproteobacteria bacterium]